MKGAVRGQYTLGFKQEAVRLVRGGEAVSSVAKTLGISGQTLHNWVKGDDAKEMKSLYCQLIYALANKGGYEAGLDKLSRRCQEDEHFKYFRAYYEELLKRSPEDAEIAAKPIHDSTETIKSMIRSDEFSGMYAHNFCNEFPSLNRELFIHIPKTGGGTILASLNADARFAIMPLPDQFFYDRSVDKSKH